MAWIIASVPFWILGAFFLWSAAAVLPYRKPNETYASLGGQIIVGLLLAGICLCVAAKVAS